MLNITVRRGDKGKAVTDLQRILKLFGYYAGLIDGNFGPATEKAVVNYQTKNKLQVDGIVGSKTRTHLNNLLGKQRTIRLGDRGNSVVVLQAILTNLDYVLGAIDGKFGIATQKAVIQYQRDNGLLVDGIVGPRSWVSFSKADKNTQQKGPVYYSQSDARWKNVMYSSHGDKKQTIGSSGCGPTCGAMVIATWRSAGVNPIQASKDALARGFRTYNNGTSWAYWPWLAKRYSLKYEQTSTTDKAVKAIKEGALVVASMGPGYFTKGGHYIVLWDVNGDSIICHDPAKKTRDRASIATFKKQNKQYFIFRR